MPKTPAPQVYMQLPDGPDRDALRAGLLALKCIPVNLPTPGVALVAQLESLALNPQALVFMDISNPLPAVNHPFDRTLRNWPEELRGRTVLTRLVAGHVSLADRTWVQALGFVDLIASFEDHSPTSPLRIALDRVASTVGLPALANDELERYLRALPVGSSSLSPRALIRAQTGLDAETLADLLQFKLEIRDRSYHLKRYPACFTGTEAVQWIQSHFRLERPQAVQIGQALQSLGLLYHVAHDKAFADEPLFFRLRAPSQLPNVNMGLVIQTLRDRLVVLDRSYLGRNYPKCWIGQDAVDVMCVKRHITRHEGELILHRLMQFGFFEHVTGEHGFIDGNYFYRFKDDPL